jgi:hypothetical protein
MTAHPLLIIGLLLLGVAVALALGLVAGREL